MRLLVVNAIVEYTSVSLFSLFVFFLKGLI